jgi:hypothetical protein
MYERTTRNIKNSRYRRLFKGCNPLQLSCNLIGNHQQTATFNFANRVGVNAIKPAIKEINDESLKSINKQQYENSFILFPFYTADCT